MGPQIFLETPFKNEGARGVLEEIMREIWKDIKGYESLYQISNIGRVKSLKRVQRLFTRIMRFFYNHKGYRTVSLNKEGIKKNFTVHKLVLSTFGPRQPSKIFQVNHKDGIKTNNEIGNLEWLTAKENTKHAIEVLGHNYGVGNDRNSAKLTIDDVRKIKLLLAKGEMLTSIAKIFNVTPANIYYIKIGKTWSDI